VLTDDDPAFYPAAFEATPAGLQVRVEFYPAKLLYYKKKAEIPEYRRNPFPFVTRTVLEELQLKKAGRKVNQKELTYRYYRFKKRLSLRLLEGGFSEEYTRSRNSNCIPC